MQSLHSQTPFSGIQITHQTPHMLYTSPCPLPLHSGLKLFKPWVDTLAPANQPDSVQLAFLSCFSFQIYLLFNHIACSQFKPSPTHPEFRIEHTILNNLHAGSLGCAPTPSQYFALAESSLISFQRFPSPSIGALGIGSYVPVFSSASCPLPGRPFLLDSEPSR